MGPRTTGGAAPGSRATAEKARRRQCPAPGRGGQAWRSPPPSAEASLPESPGLSHWETGGHAPQSRPLEPVIHRWVESPWAAVKCWQIFLCTCTCDIFCRKGTSDLVRLKWAPNPERPRITALEGPRVPLPAVGLLLGVTARNRATHNLWVCPRGLE